MKTRILRMTLALILLLVTGTVRLAAQTPQREPLDQYIESSMKAWKVPGVAVAIVHDQSVVFLKGFGVRNIQTKQPVTPDTIFDIGSCTKAFTSAAVAMLVDEGKMQWDGKVNKYIPLFHLYDPLADENVTIRDLLAHRTGVPGTDLLWYGAPFTQKEIIQRVAFAKPNIGFRAGFQYQNVMYAAAGYAVGEVAGKTWDDFVRQRLFEPLGMRDSDTSAVDAQRAPDFASPHTEKKDGSVEVIPWKNIDNVAPAGAINSSVADMAHWIMFQLHDGVYDGKRLISEKNMKAMHTPQIVVPPGGEIPTVFFPDSMQLSYGMGWFIQDYRGHQLILHPGDIDGFSALVALIPEILTGYVVLINLGGGTYRQVLGYHIADSLLHLSTVDWSTHFRKLETKIKAEQKKAQESWESKKIPNTRPSRDLAAYVGTYNNPLYGNVEIKLDDGKLVFHFYALKSTLEHFQYDTFVANMEGRQRLTFSLDADGNVALFHMIGAKFKRVEEPAATGGH